MFKQNKQQKNTIPVTNTAPRTETTAPNHGNHPPRGPPAPGNSPKTRLTRLLPHQIHSLRCPPHPQRPKLNQVKAETAEHHLHVHPPHRRHQYLPGPEHTLDDGEGTLPRRTLPVNPRIPQPVPDAKRVAPRRPPHGCVPATGYRTMVPLVPVRHLPGPGQVYLAVMHRGWGRLQFTYEDMVGVGLGVQRAQKT